MKNPKIDKSAYIDKTAVIYGDVTISENCSIWPNSVIRGDRNSIIIGKNTNVQDNVTIHTNEKNKVTIGNNVSIGHNAVIHGCTIKDNCIIGMGAIVMDSVTVEENCIVAAGAIVTKGRKIPKNSLIMGIPAKVVRTLTKKETSEIKKNAEIYVKLSQKYRKKRC